MSSSHVIILSSFSFVNKAKVGISVILYFFRSFNSKSHIFKATHPLQAFVTKTGNPIKASL